MATNSGPQLFGSAKNNSMWGDSRVYVTMSAGLGDDIYYLYSARNSAFEKAGEGVDTISTWMSYTLPANIENLTVTDDKRYAFGNALDNIITGGSGQQTLDGGVGNDVLKGGSGADIFIISEGNGSDLILDFGIQDQVRLEGYGFISFDAVQSRMTRTGTGVRLDLGGDEILVFANTSIDQFHAAQFKLNLDKSEMTLSFSDSSTRSTSGTARAVPGRRRDSNFWWGRPNGSTHVENGERQWYSRAASASVISATPKPPSVGPRLPAITTTSPALGHGDRPGDRFAAVAGDLKVCGSRRRRRPIRRRRARRRSRSSGRPASSTMLRTTVASAGAAGTSPSTQITRPRGKLPRRPQRGPQGRRRLGGVDEHGKVLSAVDPLHAGRQPVDRFDARGDRLQVDAVRQRHRGRGQAVRHVGVADDRRPHRRRLAAGDQHEHRLAGVPLDDVGGDLRLVAQAVGERRRVERREPAAATGSSASTTARPAGDR